MNFFKDYTNGENRKNCCASKSSIAEAELLLPGERLDDLQCGGLKVIQDPAGFCFGTDSVLLAHFARVYPGDTVIDLGTGSGVILFLLSAHTKAQKLTGIEIQNCMAERAKRSVKFNGLEGRVEIVEADLKNASDIFGRGTADLVVCNPPYGAVGASLPSASDNKAIARHEICATLKDCVSAAGKLVKNGGRIAFVHQADRLLEICDCLRAEHAQPKRVRMIYPYPYSPPNLFLIEAVKLAKPGLKWLPPLFVRDESGEYTEEMRKIYAGGANT